MQNINVFLETLQQRTELILQKAIGEWQTSDTAKMERPPDEGAWTAAQCLEHLNIYGRHYLPAIESALIKARKQGSQPAKLVNHGWLGQWFTRLMLPQPGGKLKKRMKAPKNAIPSVNPDARAMLAEFIEQQEKMITLLNMAHEVNINAIRIPSSLSPLIRLRLSDAFTFVLAHTERHVLQVESTITRF